jgi:hypothetical protein
MYKILIILTFLVILNSPINAQTVVSDNFNDNSLDTVTNWTVGTKRYLSFDSVAVNINETGQQLVITPPTSPATSSIRGIYSKTSSALTGRLLKVKAVQPLINTASFNSWTNFCAVKDENNYFCLYAQFRTLFIESRQAGVVGAYYEVPLSVQGILEDRHLYWRLKHNPTTNRVLYQSSYNNIDWVDLIPNGVAVTVADLTSGWHLELSAGSTSTTSIVNPAIFDDAFYGRPDLADAGNDKTVRVGSSIQLDGTGSLGSSITYSWGCTGPNVPTVTNGTTATPTLSNVISGEYTCTLTINGGTSTDIVNIGAVNADATTYKITGLPSWAELITGGSLTMSTAPVIPNVSWYEYTRQRELYYWATNHPAIPPRNDFTGSTITVTNGSANVTCPTANCLFLSRIETNKLVSPNMRDYITVNDGGTPRYVKVASITDNNNLVLSSNWPFTTRVGTSWNTNYQHPITGSFAQGVYIEASRYDFAVLVLEEYYRSGLTKWLTLFRKMADSRWASISYDYGCDYCPAGGDSPNPYYGEVKTLIARAADARPEMWDYLYRLVTVSFFDQMINPFIGQDFIRATMLSPGSGYSSVPSCTITTTGGGSGAVCVAELGFDSDAVSTSYTDLDKVHRVRITNQGSGYHSVTSPANIVLSGGGGSGANFTIGVNNTTGKVDGLRTLNDTRIIGYTLESSVFIATLLPNTYTNYANGTDDASTGSTIDGATKRSTLTTKIRNGVIDFIIRNQNSTGEWRWDIAALDNDTHLLINQPFMEGVNQWGLIRAHGLITSLSDKATILESLRKSLDFTYTTYGYNKPILNCTTPQRYWRTALYFGTGGVGWSPSLYEPPYTSWNVGTTDGCNPPVGARGGRYPQTFWIWPNAYYYSQTANVTYRNRADELYNSLFGGLNEVDSLTGLTGDGAFSPGSYELQSSKSKEGAESFVYTASYPSLRQVSTPASNVRCWAAPCN